MSPIFKKLFLLITTLSSTFILLVLISFTWIGYQVTSDCEISQKQYAGDCVETLSALVEDDTQNYSIRNSATWSLGQLGDPRALPVLEKYYTGNIPDREPLNKTISQYELKKAIALARGGRNITAPFWRHFID